MHRYIVLAAALLIAALTAEARAQTTATAAYQPAFGIGKITMAITNMEAMVRFYESVFDTKLEPFEAMGERFYQGRLLGCVVLFCPNRIAGVVAEQNRHQFDLLTDQIDAVVQRAVSAGGTARDGTNAGAKTATITDPDGNTMVIIQR